MCLYVSLEVAIRNQTAKFLFVLSRASNHKDNPLKELHIADSTRRDEHLDDFIIPLHIDDLPHREANIYIANKTAVPFDNGWASGLKQLLKKLAEDCVPTKPNFSPDAVASWWRQHGSEFTTVREESEEYFSDWFPVEGGLPQRIYFHSRGKRSPESVFGAPYDLYPCYPHGGHLASFAPPEDFPSPGGLLASSSDRLEFDTGEFLAGHAKGQPVKPNEASKIVRFLLKAAWLGMINKRRLPTYHMANDVTCFYFTKGLASENDWLSFDRSDGVKGRRQMVGYKTMLSGKRHWHFGVHAKPVLFPEYAYLIKAHVLFSDTTGALLASEDAMHSARRSQCKDWWNDDWRDRILATMAWLAGDKGFIELRLGSTISIKVSRHPITFSSPVSFADPADPERLDDAREGDAAADDLEEKGSG